MTIWKGVFIPIITPFTGENKLNIESLKAHIEWLISCNVDGIIAVGSTGESSLLSFEEKKEVFETAVEVVNKRIPVIGGTTADSTQDSIELSIMAEKVGMDGLMVMPPIYSKVNMQQAYQHLKNIALSVKIPVMLYNNPARCMIDLSADCIVELSKVKNIRYLKEASGEVNKIHKIIRKTQEKFSIFTGFDTLALEAFASGATGWVTVSGNVVPKQCCEIMKLALNLDFLKAREKYYSLLPILELIEESGQAIQCLKYALNSIGNYKVGKARAPLSLYEISDEMKNNLLSMLNNLSLNIA